MTIHDIPEETIQSTPYLYTPLQRALIAAGAPVLAAHAVADYQRRARLRRAARYLVNRLPVLLIFPVLAAAGFWSGSRCSGSFGDVVTGLAGVCLLFGCFLLYCIFSSPLAQWTCTAPNFLPGSIPEKLKDRASAVLRLCPDSFVYAEVLLDDPFLIVGCGWEKYYIGVWDESGWR